MAIGIHTQMLNQQGTPTVKTKYFDKRQLQNMKSSKQLPVLFKILWIAPYTKQPIKVIRKITHSKKYQLYHFWFVLMYVKTHFATPRHLCDVSDRQEVCTWFHLWLELNLLTIILILKILCTQLHSATICSLL